jgi:hypothetical protein
MATAADQYTISHAAALSLIAELQQAIEDMPDPESINGDWGYAGSMTHINDQLRGLLAFVGNDNA